MLYLKQRNKTHDDEETLKRKKNQVKSTHTFFIYNAINTYFKLMYKQCDALSFASVGLKVQI